MGNGLWKGVPHMAASTNWVSGEFIASAFGLIELGFNMSGVVSLRPSFS